MELMRRALRPKSRLIMRGLICVCVVCIHIAYTHNVYTYWVRNFECGAAGEVLTASIGGEYFTSLIYAFWGCKSNNITPPPTNGSQYVVIFLGNSGFNVPKSCLFPPTHFKTGATRLFFSLLDCPFLLFIL